MEILQHLHLQRVIAHGNEAIFWLHKVDANERIVARIHGCLDGLEPEERLGKDGFGRVAAQHLIDVTDHNFAGRRSMRSAAVLDVAAQTLCRACIFAVRENLFQRPHRFERIAIGGKVQVQRVLPREECRMLKWRRLHQLKVLLILARSPAGNFVHPFSNVLLAQPMDAVKRCEKLVVPAEVRCRDKAPHGKRVDKPVV